MIKHQFAAVIALFPALALAHGDYAAWSKKNTDSAWTAAAEAAVKSSSLPKTVPKDVAKFCPNYFLSN